MAGSESIQRALTRVRPPRVKITYDVETGNAIEKKELPFVVGILADLSGEQPDTVTPVPLKDRKFIEIDRDNFNDVLKAIAPKLTVKVADHLSSEAGAQASYPLSFESIDDFRPENLVDNIAVLKALLEKRNKLRDLLTKTDGNDNWAALVNDAVKVSPAVQKALAAPAANGAPALTPPPAPPTP